MHRWVLPGFSVVLIAVACSGSGSGDSAVSPAPGPQGEAGAPPTDASIPRPGDAGSVLPDVQTADGSPDGTASCTPAGSPPADAPGCAGVTLLARPSDPGAAGPWAVGAHTSTVAGFTTEIWYPAKWGTQVCQPKVAYDLREHLPTADQAKIPDSANPLQLCDCYRDLPIDDTHGPYPVVTFIHGTAAFRTQSLTFATHWASRGFVVVSSDHPGDPAQGHPHVVCRRGQRRRGGRRRRGARRPRHAHRRPRVPRRSPRHETHGRRGPQRRRDRRQRAALEACGNRGGHPHGGGWRDRGRRSAVVARDERGRRRYRAAERADERLRVDACAEAPRAARRRRAPVLQRSVRDRRERGRAPRRGREVRRDGREHAGAPSRATAAPGRPARATRPSRPPRAGPS